MAGDLKVDRVLELFFRAMKGEALVPQHLAQVYKVSPRSISRDITSLKMFLADHRNTIGNAELEYSSVTHAYRLLMDNFITNKELLAVTKALIGCKPFNTQELLTLIGKLKSHTSAGELAKLDSLLHKELYHYAPIHFDCPSVIDNVWALSEHIEKQQAITITYHRMDRTTVKHKLKPVSLMFTEYYFYLLAYLYDTSRNQEVHYFRVDRIMGITVHRETFKLTKEQNVDEGVLRQRSQFMWPGKLRRIRFEFTGPSVQAVLDRLPTAKVVEVKDGRQLLEAEVYGDGIKMYLLSQGSWVKVLAPAEFVAEMREEVRKLSEAYGIGEK